MLSRFLGLVASAAVLTAVPTVAGAQKVDAQKIRNLKSQQTDIENRIADLQRQVDDAYAGKGILTFDEPAALAWARIMVDGKAQGFTLDVSDMIIAATAEANHCIVVTANENDFRTVAFFNPMAG